MDDCLQKLPKRFLEKVEKVVPENLKPSVYKGLQVRRPTTFRTNTLKISTEELEKELIKRGVKFEEVPFYKDGFVLVSPSKRELIDLDIYTQGLLYVQSLSSMIPPLVLDPREDEKILDLTAAPGSKTTQIAMMMGNSGKIVANDRSKVRLFKLEYNLKMQGVKNVEVSYGEGKDFWKKCPEEFDRVLVDVPCSLEGRFNCSDPKSFKNWAPGKVKMLSSLQKFLLRSAVSACKVGGVVVYSTCTLSIEENEEVVDWILQKDGGAVELEEVNIGGLDGIKGIEQMGQKKFDPQVSKCLRIFPSETMEGFFVAKLRKVKSSVGINS